MSSEQLPPAQPSFVLRGHSAQVHAVRFIQGNARLLSADAEGWIVSWSLASKRPVAVWRAHINAVLGISSWGQDRIITHGRDSKLAVWQLGLKDENSIGTTLPVDNPPTTTPQPWLLHMLTVNTLNFCSFAMCLDGIPQTHITQMAIKARQHPPPILIAVPNTIDSGGVSSLIPHIQQTLRLPEDLQIDVYQLPSESRAAMIHADRNITTGMVMALDIQAESTRLQVVAGYESGHTMVFVQSDPGAQFQRLYCAQPHSQPTDAIIAKHPLPAVQGIWKTELKPFKVVQTKHSGQQGLQVRSDGKIFATAGWDSRVRVYSSKTMKELAVLKWHKVGCYTTAFAEVESCCCSIKMEDDVPVKQEDTDDQDEKSIVHDTAAISTFQQRRDIKAQTTHWLAAGSKDGKISLWDIY
ncbi:MAG: hypothetical protein Q9182_000415 [Xanthomendoza sp. 2 TL-2023]